MLRFAKGHGTENDFVLLPDPAAEIDLTPRLVRALCDRRTGIGADGVLRVVPSELVADAPGGETAAWFMDYRNADGSVAEMCGNGIRVYARYLVEAGLAEPGRLRLATRTGIRSVVVGREGDVCVDMGEAVLGGEAAAVIGESNVRGARVDMGNPHLAVLVDEPLASYDLSRPPIVDQRDFPDGVNVELVAVLDRGHVEMRVFERGVGETRSCGTGACAAAVAAAQGSDVDVDRWLVDVPGGRLIVELHHGAVQLVGPAVLVGSGIVNDEWLSAVAE